MSFFEELKRRNVVRVGAAYGIAAWVILQVADLVLENIEAPPWVIQAMMLVVGLGFIAALIIAWAYEMTPEGIKREADVDRSQSVVSDTGRKLDRIVIGFMALALAWFVYDKQSAAPPTVTPTPEEVVQEPVEPETKAELSIAVLPFVNMSADPDNEYFSDGISEELLNVLFRVSALQVASRTSSFAYKGKELPISQIARELNVSHILEGSVRKAGNEVRITAQLIDAANDRHLWSNTYQRELDDIFDIQVEISNSIVNALKLVLGVDEIAAMERLQRPTNNPEAYEFYLRGRHQWRLRTEVSLFNAIGSFEKAIELEPSFARAYEALASTHVVLPSWSDVAVDVAISSALDAANRALELDGSLAEAHTIRALAFELDHQWADSMREFENALDLEPRNATAHQWYAEFLSDIGYNSIALEHIRRAYELDPASPVINMIYAAIASGNLEDDLAIKHTNQAKELGLNPVRALLASLPVIIRRGDLEKHQETLLAAQAGSELMKPCFQAVLNPELFDLVRQVLDNEPPRRGRIFCATMVGDIDRALEYLEAEVQEDSTILSFAWGSAPGIGVVRQSGGFKELIDEFGLLEFYRENGWPDVCRPVGDEDFECD